MPIKYGKKKYEFKELKEVLSKKSGVRNPGGLVAHIEKMQHKRKKKKGSKR